MQDNDLQRRKKITATIAIAVVVGMVGFAFASAPLYRLVCKAFGINGTTQTALTAPAATSNEDVTVRFDANVDRELPWEFKPNQKSVTIKFGETKTVSYHARNLSQETVVGTATFNVTPEKIGPYFDKLECFCFTDQTLAPGQEADLAVTFFVDPDLLKDEHVDEVRTITLSYTFFRSANGVAVDSRQSAAALSVISAATAAPVPTK